MFIFLHFFLKNADIVIKDQMYFQKLSQGEHLINDALFFFNFMFDACCNLR